MTDTTELIERLERATGPDRELANDVLFACGWRMVEYGTGPVRPLGWENPAGEDCFDGDQPDPTDSIDAAWMLLSAGWAIERLSWWPRIPSDFEDQQKCSVTIIAIDHAGWGDHKRRFQATASTPALAISAASLRARAAEQQP